ncbi:DegT/DnrJ/EryC1/StrS family aminotransferase [Candidatus Pacearchaeota archaeon]|nr:DegT/DnrJ/EryC1/StrS family aminotransferase [Candidatus Pacearchaeota archaeon]
MPRKIPLFKIYWDEDDIKLTENAIKKGMNWAIGANVEKFEEKISNFIGTKYSVVFNSGTSALHSVLLAYGISEGDEVIVPSFTFIATANAPLFVGAKSVFADIEEEKLGLDPEDVKEKITKKTKAIIPVHYGGCPSKIKELKKVAEDHNLILIEDAAESFGAKINNQNIGTFGDSAMFSFCQNKIISTGEGGAITTDSKETYERLKLIRSHGRSEDQNYFQSSAPSDYVTLGYNFRMSNIIAALGVSQLKKIDMIINMRRRVAGILNEKISKIDNVRPPIQSKDSFHVYQLYTIRTHPSMQDSLINYLNEKGIMSKIYFEPIHQTHYYKNVLGYDVKLPVTERVSKEVLSLPIYPTISDKDIGYICENIKKCSGEC